MAEVSGKFRFQAVVSSDYPAVGDFVLVNWNGSGSSAIIESVLPRKGAFVRKAVGEPQQEQIVAANISIDEDGTTVEVTFQYNKMRGTASGNLIVILLDINGQPLEKQQSCTKQDGLLELSNERSATQSFTFM